MHVVEAARGRGTGGAILAHLIADAAAPGITRLSLETGSWSFPRTCRRDVPPPRLHRTTTCSASTSPTATASS